MRDTWRLLTPLLRRCYRRNPGGVRVLHDLPGGPSKSTASPAAVEQQWDAPGFLITWNIHIGLSDPLFMELCRQAGSGLEVVDVCRASRAHQEHYAEFVDWVRALTRRLGLASWACCMEASLCASEKGKVHLHAFVGPTLSGPVLAGECKPVHLNASDVVWHSMQGFVSALRGRKAQAAKRATGGWFYCVGPKVGSVFRDSHLLPFQDASYPPSPSAAAARLGRRRPPLCSCLAAQHCSVVAMEQ